MSLLPSYRYQSSAKLSSQLWQRAERVVFLYMRRLLRLATTHQKHGCDCYEKEVFHCGTSKRYQKVEHRSYLKYLVTAMWAITYSNSIEQVIEVQKSLGLTFIGWPVPNAPITLLTKYFSLKIIAISMISKMPINPRAADRRSHSVIS